MKRVAALDDGFTLVEMLVTLALLGMMATYAVQSFQTLYRLDELAQKSERRNELASILKLLRSEIASAKPVFSDPGTAGQKLMFQGTETSLSFVAPSNGSTEFGGLYLINLAVNEKHQLMMTRKLLQSSAQMNAEVLVLLNDVRDFHIQYSANSPLSNAKRQSETTWWSHDNLPAGVALEINVGSNEVGAAAGCATALQLAN